MSDLRQLREDFINAIQHEVEAREQVALLGDRSAVEELINGGFQIADQGYVFAVDSVLLALTRLLEAGVLVEKDRGWFLNLRGRVALDGSPVAAQGWLEEAAGIGSRLGDRTLVASSMMNLGICAWRGGDLNAAIQYLDLSIANRSRRDRFGRAQGLVNLVGAYLELGDVSNARTVLRKLDRMTLNRSGPSLYSSILGVRGLVAANMGDLATAEDAFRESARAALSAEAWGHLLPALLNVGAVKLDRGQPGLALRWLRRAERLGRFLLAYEMVESAQRTQGTALHRTHRSAEARRLLESGRQEALERSDQLSWARLSGDLGALEVATGRHGRAVAPLEEAVKVLVGSREVEPALVTTRTLASALIATGRFEEAEARVTQVAETLRLPRARDRRLKESLADLILAAFRPERAAVIYSGVARRIGRAEHSASVELWRIGLKLLDANDPVASSRVLSRALGALNDSDTAVSPYQILNDRALAYLASRRNVAAERDLRDALALATEQEDRPMQALILSNLSESRRRLNHFEDAVELATRSISISRETGDLSELARASSMRGLAHASAENWEAARGDHLLALRVARQSGDLSTEAVALGGLAQTSFAIRRYKRARSLYQQSAELEQRLMDWDHEAESRAALVEVGAVLTDPDQVRRDLQRLIDLVQQKDASVATAITGIARAGGAWLRNGRTREAGETFLAGILLALAQWRDPDDHRQMRHAGTAFVAPYAYARLIDATAVPVLDRLLRSRLRRKLGDSFPVAATFLDEAQATNRASPKVR